MRHLSNDATATFQRLLSLGESKISNSEAFMPVYFEEIYETSFGKIYSLAHYYKQNGDTMADPEMTFIILNDNNIYPMSYRQDGLGLMRESMFIENEKMNINFKLQAEQTIFANMWLRNIKQQQNL